MEGLGCSHFPLQSTVPSVILRAKDCGLVGSSRTQRDCKLEGSGATPNVALMSVCRDTGLGRENEAGRRSPTGCSSIRERPLNPVTCALGLAGPQGAAAAHMQPWRSLIQPSSLHRQGPERTRSCPSLHSETVAIIWPAPRSWSPSGAPPAP